MRRYVLAAFTLAIFFAVPAVHAACPTIVVGPSVMPDGTINQPYSQLLTATNAATPYQFGVSGGSLPPGLRVFGDRINGIASAAGLYSFTINVLDVNGCSGSRAYTIKVVDPSSSACPDMSVSPTGVPSGTVGTNYSQKFTPTGGTAPYRYTTQGSVPPGLSVINGVLAGVPNAAGVFGFDLIVIDSKSCMYTQHYELEILAAGCSAVSPSIIAPQSGASLPASNPIVFSWSGVPDATGYELLTSNDNGVTYTVARTVDGATTSTSISLSSGSYAAYVRAILSNSCSTRAPVIRFTVTAPSNCSTATPSLANPRSGANVSPNVVYQWTEVAGATSYRLFTAVNGAPFENVATSNTASLTRTTPVGTVDWYVEAQLPGGCPATRSTTSRFTVSAAPCGTGSVSLTSPSSNATVSSPASFAWTAVAGASAYRVWVAIDGSIPSAIARVTTTTTTVPLPSGNAEWFVEAIFDDCPSIISPRGRFTVGRGATCGSNAAPVLSAPVGSTTPNAVTFTWGAANGANAYRLWIAESGQAFTDSGLTTAATARRTLSNGSYSWYVEAIYGGCPVVASTPATFRVAENSAGCPTTAPSALSPAEGATATSPVTFTWTTVPGAKEYRLFASLNGGDLRNVDTTNGTTITKAMPPGTIVWIVEAVFNGCPSTRSQAARFTVPRGASCPTVKPQLLSPANGSSNVTSPVTFSWSVVPGATRYIVVAKTRAGTATPIGETTATQLERDLPAGTIEWLVIALGSGCDPLSSDPATFTIPTPAGCDAKRPHPLAPADDAINVASPVRFQWTRSAGAVSYRVFAAIAGEEPVLIATSTTNEVTAAVPSGRIRWFVQAVFNGCPALHSALSDVTVSGKPSGCDVPATPKAHVVAQVLSATEYNVRWTGVANASVYELQESATADFASPTTTTVNAVSAAFTHTATGSPVQYFYRVRAVSSCSEDRSSFSRPVSTRVVPPNARATKTPSTAEMGVQNNVVQTIELPGSATPVAFTATTDKPWLVVTPASGIIPPSGLTLTVTADPRALNVGANHGTVRITYATSSNLIGTHATTSSIPISISLVTPVVPDTKAGPPPESLIIPAVAHGPGANSSLFKSDVRLANTSSLPMNYLLNFTPTATDGTQTGTNTTIQVDPGATVALDDILASFFGTAANGSSTGMLEIRPLSNTSTSSLFGAVPSSALASIASSRTYNVTDAGTFGQFIPAIPFADFVGKGSILSLQQIAQSTAYRTNFGLVEGSGEAATVLLHVFDKAGNRLADIAESLLPSEHKALNGLLAANNIVLEDGRVEVEVTSATGKVSAYASVLDNRTNDPLLVSAVLKSAPFASRYVLPGVAYTSAGIATWRTDVRLYNAAATSVSATVTYYPEAAPLDASARTITIAAGETRALDNILNTMFGISGTNATGSIIVSTNGASSIIASARTYAQADSGTIGQFIPAVTPDEAVGAGERPLQILQLEQSEAFRTNIGLAETSGNPATAEVSLVLPDSKITPVFTWPLKANEFVQIPLSFFGLTENIYNARVSIRVIDGTGRVTAYGSLIDNISKDPTYVPAQ